MNQEDSEQNEVDGMKKEATQYRDVELSLFLHLRQIDKFHASDNAIFAEITTYARSRLHVSYIRYSYIIVICRMKQNHLTYEHNKN